MKIKILGAALAVSCAAGAFAPSASAAADPFIGEIALFPYTFCPRGWAPADGQLMSISQNTALFSLYGTTYGGDGRTTFALPDLRGRLPMHRGDGPGLTERRIGEMLGSETHILTELNMPSHVHGVSTVQTSVRSRGDREREDGSSRQTAINGVAAPGDTADGAVETSATGGGRPVNNMPPVVVVQYCVALQGIYPSRS